MFLATWWKISNCLNFHWFWKWVQKALLRIQKRKWKKRSFWATTFQPLSGLLEICGRKFIVGDFFAVLLPWLKASLSSYESYSTLQAIPQFTSIILLILTLYMSSGTFSMFLLESNHQNSAYYFFTVPEPIIIGLCWNFHFLIFQYSKLLKKML